MAEVNEILLRRNYDGRVRVEIVALHLDHSKNPSDPPDKNVVKMDTVLRAPFSVKDDSDGHRFVGDGMRALEGSHLLIKERFDKSARLVQLILLKDTHVVWELKRKVKRDTIKRFSGSYRLLMLLQ